MSIAYKIPTIVSVLGATISKAFAISVLQNFSGEDEDGFVGNSYRIISLFVVLIASGLMLLNIPVARILFQKEFFAAWQLVPPLLFSAIMNQMSLCCENICFAMGETKKLSQTALLGAGVNTVLNFCMIPHMGAYGAAVATAISFSVVWLMRYIWIKKNMELKNSQVHEFLSYGVLLLQMFFAYWGNQFLGIQLVGCGFLILLNWDQILKFMKYNLRKVIK